MGSALQAGGSGLCTASIPRGTVQSYAFMVLRSPLGFGIDRILYSMLLSVTDPLAMPEGGDSFADGGSGAVIIGVAPRKSSPTMMIPVWSP